MKIGMRATSMAVALIALLAAAAMYFAGERIDIAAQTSNDARDAILNAYRIAQSLKSSAASYELTMNEYYSTVLEFPTYRAKSDEQRAAIERDLALLNRLEADNAAAVARLARGFQEMDAFRRALEGALAGDDKDWDGAREALFKLNVLSVQAIHQADVLGQLASERAVSLDNNGQGHQSQALRWLRFAMALAIAAAILSAIAALRAQRCGAKRSPGE